VSLVLGTADPAERRRGLDAARSAVRRGDLVVLPPDTVYGVGTDAFSPHGVERLRSARGAAAGSPLPVLVPGAATVDGLAYGLSREARDLIEAFWPGALTIVVRCQPTLAWDIGGAGTVSLRMPLHPVALELLRETGPMAVTAANVAGMQAPVTLEDARDQLGDAVSVYLDGGPLGALPTSTVVDLTGDVPRVLRAGAVDLETLREVCPTVEGSDPADG
jgi:L-threonylcarbamoyladenylate synthase